MDYIPLVRAGALLPFLSYLREIGTPVDRLLLTVKLSSDALQDSDGLIPLHAGIAFLEQAARSEGLGTLGLSVGQQTPLERLGAFGVLVRDATTLLEAVNIAQQLITAFNSGARIWLEQEGGLARIFHRILTAPSTGRRQVDQYSVMLILNLVRLAAGPDWKPREVWLQMPYDRDVVNFEAFAEARLLFNQPASALILPRELLGRPLGRARVTDASHASDRDRLRSSAPAMDLAGSLKQVLLNQLHAGCPGIKRVAEVSGIGVRSLQRHLLAEGLQFSKLVDRVRLDRAVVLLSDPTIKLKDIATELGYHDYANFTRAFHRWTGLSPRGFRHRLIYSRACPAGLQ